VIQRAAALSESLLIRWEDLPPEIRAVLVEKRFSMRQAVQATAQVRQERELLLKVLRECSGNITEASRQLGLSRMTLYRKMKKYSISRLEFLGSNASADEV